MIETKIQMRFADIDVLGHVNNVNQQHYFDLGKCDFYKQVLGLTPFLGIGRTDHRGESDPLYRADPQGRADRSLYPCGPYREQEFYARAQIGELRDAGGQDGVYGCYGGL